MKNINGMKNIFSHGYYEILDILKKYIMKK